MFETSNPRRPARSRLWSRRAVVYCVSAAAALALAVLPGRISRATARQVPGSPDQMPTAAGQPGVLGVPGSAADAQSAPKPEQPPTPAEVLIDEARAKVARLESAAANLEEKVDMLDQRITIKGRFLKAPQHRIYLSLAVSGLPETGGTSLQVCDGETLWQYQAVLDAQAYYKMSIKPVMLRLDSPELDPKTREQITREMGFAGPETLLAGLRQVFRFDQDKEDSTLDGKPVWILRGSWKDRQRLTGIDSRIVAQTGMLPPYIPSDAALYLGKDDGWPYKLVLSGRKPSAVMDTRPVGPDGQRIGSRSSIQTVDPTRITLVYTDVQLNPTIPTEEFVFRAPSSASVEDGTEMLVKQLDQIIQVQADRKKQETTKKEGPELPQSLEIPTPPGLPPTGTP